MSDTTVLMTVYRTDPRFLHQAIQSILAQTEPDFKFQIVFDGPAHPDQLRVLPKDDRIWVCQLEENIGLTAALNYSLEHLIETPFILRQDADDVSLPGRLAVLRRWMQTHPTCGAVGDNYAHIDENGSVIRVNSADPERMKPRRYKEWGLAGTVAGGGVMLRTDAVKEVSGWKYPVAQDCYMWHALLACGWQVQSVQQTLYQWRVHSGQISDGRREEQRRCVKQILEEFHIG